MLFVSTFISELVLKVDQDLKLGFTVSTLASENSYCKDHPKLLFWDHKGGSGYSDIHFINRFG